MELHLTWKTKAFRRTFEILKNEIKVGQLRKESFSRKTTGWFNTRKITFLTKGFFGNETTIIDSDTSGITGTISYYLWRCKSTITYNDKEYYWLYDNLFGTRWSLGNENGVLIRYHSRCFKGTIDSYTDDEVLILTGFFIRNYLKQRAAATAAAS
ncbi:MAG: hypothetical protein Q8868_01800 [Bacteroidota bacterium]|nr:hypothetical protein [Bacteroidota bacterium]